MREARGACAPRGCRRETGGWWPTGAWRAGRRHGRATAAASCGASCPTTWCRRALRVPGGLPLTPNGKVDRKALPAPEPDAATEAGVQWRRARAGEEVLAEIWGEVLGRERVGRHDNFFELGGHSLLATQVDRADPERVPGGAAAARPVRGADRRRPGRAVDGARRSERRAAAAAARAPARGSGTLPLSFAQQRLWFLDQLEPGAAAYNIPSRSASTGALDAAALERALERDRRAATRCCAPTFAAVDGRPVQVIAPAAPIAAAAWSTSRLCRDRSGRRRRGGSPRGGAAPVRSVAGARCCAAALLRLDDEEHVLLLTMHHIVADGWSLGVLPGSWRRSTTPSAPASPRRCRELPIQYADYAVWQREWLQGEAAGAAARLLEEQLRGGAARCSICPPTGRGRRCRASAARGRRFALPPRRSRAGAARRSRRRAGATLFMTLLAAFQALLHRYTGQDDLVVGTPIANRTPAASRRG